MKTIDTAFICSESLLSLKELLRTDRSKMLLPTRELHVGDVVTFDEIPNLAVVVTSRWVDVGANSERLYYFVEQAPFPGEHRP